MFKSFIRKQSVRFRRFSHKAYAAFVSIHREVTIGAIRAYMTDLELLKQGKSMAVVVLCISSLPMAAEEPDERELDTLLTHDAPQAIIQLVQDDAQQLSLQEVLVVSNKTEVESEAYRLITQISHSQIKALPIQTVADILQYLPGVDVRTRGTNGAQADVSMRGGTFDQVLVLLNGVSINDVQTGHYNLNLPLSTDLIERVEVLVGTDANRYGAFSGAINIVTRKAQKDQYDVRLSAGMNGLVNPSLSGSWTRGEWTANASVEYSRAEGYNAPSPSEKERIALRNSDYQWANIYFQTQYKGLNLQFGAQWKDVGAGMFYGFGSQDQFDATRTAFGSASYSQQWGRWGMELQTSYRANYDRYEWHRGERLYGNFHFSQTTSALVQVYFTSSIGKTTLGMEVRNENIHSTNLGDTINPMGQRPNVDGFPLQDVRVLDLLCGANRLNVNYFAQQTFHYEDLSASLGLNGMYNTFFGHHMTGALNMRYACAREAVIYLNAQRALRLPTFTDLYYNAGNQLGNRHLQPEEAWTLSLGGRYDYSWGKAGRLSFLADWYYRWGRNIIDWVYVAEDAKRPYHAENQQKVDATGIETSLTYHWNEWIRCIQIDYAYTFLNLDLKEAQSRYLDYLSHKLVLRLEHGIYHGFGATWMLRFQQREGQYNDVDGKVRDYQPVWLVDGSLYWQNPTLRISLDCTNITNRRYYDYGGILQPGAWAKITIQAHL